MNNSTIWWIILIIVVLLGAYFLFVNREPVEAPGVELPEVTEPIPTQPGLPKSPGTTSLPGGGTLTPKTPGTLTPVE